MNIALLNTSILTTHGVSVYAPLTLQQAQWLVNQPSATVTSAIGHDATAQILSELLGQDVPVNRIQYKQRLGDVAIVFKLNGRPPEGRILTAEECHAIGFTFGALITFNLFSLRWWKPQDMPRNLAAGCPVLLDTRLSQEPLLGFVSDKGAGIQIAGGEEFAFTARGIERITVI